LKSLIVSVFAISQGKILSISSNSRLGLEEGPLQIPDKEREKGFLG